MKAKKKKKKKKPYTWGNNLTACKGKKGGCYWEGEPEGITTHELRLAA